MGDILEGDELGMFSAPAVVDAINDLVVKEGKTVFVVEADNEEDWKAERNLRKKVAILPYAEYRDLVTGVSKNDE